MTAGARRGFTLVEIMMAVVIFSVVVLSLVGLSFRVSKSSTRNTDQALSMAVLLSKVDRAATVNLNSLSSIATCDTTLSSQVKVIGCTVVSTLSPRLDSVQIVVWTSLPNARPDTMTMLRGKPPSAIPLR